MREITLETIIDKLTDYEIKDLCFCINHFGNRKRGGGIYADEFSVKFYKRKYAEDCINDALKSDGLTREGKCYLQQLKDKMESL